MSFRHLSIFLVSILCLTTGTTISEPQQDPDAPTSLSFGQKYSWPLGLSAGTMGSAIAWLAYHLKAQQTRKHLIQELAPDGRLGDVSPRALENLLFGIQNETTFSPNDITRLRTDIARLRAYQRNKMIAAITILSLGAATTLLTAMALKTK